MTEKIKNKKEIAFISAIGMVLALAGVLRISGVLPEVLAVLSEETIEVSAEVQAWSVFTVTPTSTILSPYLVTTAQETNIASSTNISIEVGTNHAEGWHIQIQGTEGGLLHTDTTTKIASVAMAATTTLTAGMATATYGANASSAVATVGTYYDYWDSDDVGAIAASSSPQTLVSKGTPNDTQQVAELKIKAAVPITQKIGVYSDIVFLTLVGGTP